MKKIFVCLAVGLVCVAAPAESPLAYTVSPTNVCLLPMRTGEPKGNLQAWATGTVVAGQVVVANGVSFYAVNAGTSTNPPTVTAGGSSTNDGITWVKFDNQRRRGLRITLTTTNNMYLSIGHPAVIGAGIYLVGKGASYEPVNVPQESIQAISEGGNASPCVQDY